jgi:hypothetical protein
MSDRYLALAKSGILIKWLKNITFAPILLVFVSAPPAVAQDFLDETFLLNVTLGSSRSAIARSLADGGYELSDGTPVDFSDWYSPRYPDLTFLFLTKINETLGLSWGVSFGERGEKYRISPGVWIGLVYRKELSRNSSLTLSALTLLGGDFRERACVADYGAIGGVQQVNCRLAASFLPPNETLKFLVKERGIKETRFSLRYEFRF